MVEKTQPSHGVSGNEDAHTVHPTPTTYVKVAMGLVALTALEVAIFYVEWLGWVMIPIMLGLAVAKFSIVAMFYMHLRYDARLFSGFFVGGLILAILVFISVMSLLRIFV